MHVWCRSLPNCRLVGEDLNISKKNFHQHSAKGAVCHIDTHLLFFQKAPFWFEIFWYHSLKKIAVDLLPVLKQKPGETPSVKASAEQREALHDFLEKLKHCRFHCWRILQSPKLSRCLRQTGPDWLLQEVFCCEAENIASNPWLEHAEKQAHDFSSFQFELHHHHKFQYLKFSNFSVVIGDLIFWRCVSHPFSWLSSSNCS